jgi:glycosyltransferase involved in cell wall biosynthesis
VSVLLAVYNAAAYVEQAVCSVLDQTYRDLELIIIDDGSRDGSPRILEELARRDPRIRLTHRPNKGIPATANDMVRQARGRYLSLMDHDDVMLPECLATEVPYLEAHPECVAVGALTAYINAEGHVFKRKKRNVSSTLFAVSRRPAGLDVFPATIPSISNPSALVRADAMHLAGGYRENMPFAHDTDLWFRLSRLGEIHRLNRVLLNYRIHGTNTTVEHRAKIVLYEIIAILSGIAGRHGLDDSMLIGRFAGASNYDDTATGYGRLIGDRYPVRTFLLFRAVGSGVPAAAGAASIDELHDTARRHALSMPFSYAKLQLLRRLVSRKI